jgi:hypothetical protein
MAHDETESAKLCTGCKRVKSLSGFAKNRCAKDGLQSRCRPCQLAAVRLGPSQRAQRARGEARRRARELLREAQLKRCSTCTQAKPFGEFYSNRSAADGLSADCRDCRSAMRSGTSTRPVTPRAKSIESPDDALVAVGREMGFDVITCSKPSRRSCCACGARRVATCGFPNGDTTCGEPLCDQCVHQVRDALVYCGPHFERSQAALADLARRRA